jgi:hypothetical protein
MSGALSRAGRPSASQLLARLLDSPHLAAEVQSLPPELLGRVIEHVGLEDAGELVAFATTEQLARVFDDDLWRSERPGEDERFDADRFLVWLSVMREAGDAFLAERLAALPPDLVTLAFHRQVLVLDVEAMLADMRDADEADATQIEKALSDCLSEELDTFQLIARRHEGFDDVIAALVALDQDHHDLLTGILERCAAMSAEQIEDNGGLYDVLTSEEMLESDVAAEREDRRAEAGHVAPSSARAFLELARGESDLAVRDALTRAYFRGLAKGVAPASKRPAPPAPAAAPAPDLVRLLRDAGIVEPPRRLLPAPGAAEPLLVAAMRPLAAEPAFAERGEELAYLANVLAAGCSFRGRRFRPAEAVRAAIATCSLGLELVSGARIRDATAALRTHTADTLFRVAWRHLEVEVVGPARALGASGMGDDAALRALMDQCPTLDGELFSCASQVTRARDMIVDRRARLAAR